MSLPIERGMQQQPGNLALQFRSGAIAETVLKCIPERGTPDVCSTRKHKHRHSKIPAAGLSGFSPWVRCIVLLSTCWLLFELLYSILWRCIFALGWRCSVECQRVGRHPWAPKGHCAIPLRHKMSDRVLTFGRPSDRATSGFDVLEVFARFWNVCSHRDRLKCLIGTLPTSRHTRAAAVVWQGSLPSSRRASKQFLEPSHSF